MVGYPIISPSNPHIPSIPIIPAHTRTISPYFLVKCPGVWAMTLKLVDEKYPQWINEIEAADLPFGIPRFAKSIGSFWSFSPWDTHGHPARYGALMMGRREDLSFFEVPDTQIQGFSRVSRPSVTWIQRWSDHVRRGCLNMCRL